MASITTIQGADVISTSRTTINTNFANLNSDKIETSYLDTDTSLTANSDSKIATQKAVKAYVDSGGQQNASETVRGLVEEATTAEITAGTDTGGTGAKLFVPPSKMNTQIANVISTSTGAKTYTVGTLDNALVKTYFNIQLPFTLWTGAVVNDTSTTFVNWVRSSTDIGVAPLGSLIDVTGTGADDIYLDWGKALYNFNATNIVILDFWAKLPASGTGDISMGFGNQSGWNSAAYNATTRNAVLFAQKATGELYANITKDGVGVTNTDISAGLTLTNWNNYRIELDLDNEARFYVNGVLKATHLGSSANFPDAASSVLLGFGRSNTSLFKVTAPTLSLQMNP